MGGLLAQEVLRPEEQHAFTVVRREFSDDEADVIDGRIDQMTEEYIPADYSSDRVAKLRALIAEATGDGGQLADIVPIDSGQPGSGGSLIAALELSLAMARRARSLDQEAVSA